MEKLFINIFIKFALRVNNLASTILTTFYIIVKPNLEKIPIIVANYNSHSNVVKSQVISYLLIYVLTHQLQEKCC